MFKKSSNILDPFPNNWFLNSWHTEDEATILVLLVNPAENMVEEGEREVYRYQEKTEYRGSGRN